MFVWFEDSSWTLVRVEGSDRVDFLHRLTTNELPDKASPLVHNFFLSVNARIQAEFWMSAQSDYLALLTPTGQTEALSESIERYHFGEKIKVVKTPGRLFVVAGTQPSVLAPECDQVFAPDPRYGTDCCWCYTESPETFRNFLAENGEPMSEMEAERRRISLGRPRYQVDYDDTSLFVEVAQQGDFSETKGCYPGQEIVARVLHRGRLNRHMRAFESDTVIPADWELKVDGKSVASVKSTVATEEGGSIGYLLVRREYDEAEESLTGTDGKGASYTLTVKERPGEILTGDDE